MVRGTRACALVVLVLALASCLSPQLTPCGDSFCLDGTECIEDTLCARPDQIAACDGLQNGQSCSVDSGTGICDLGVCIATGCGNLIVDLGEVCDDGNTESGDGCRADCKKRELCGDAIVDDGEGCDDGNSNAADGCDLCVPTTWIPTPLIGGNAKATTTGLSRPRGIAIDQSGNLYIADTDNHRIRRVDATSGDLTTIAGTGVPGFDGDGGTATSALLNMPTRVDVDGLGNVFIVDNRRVRRIDPDGIITTVAGTGADGYNGDGIPAISAQLDRPTDVMVDGLGNFYIADAFNKRVRRVDPNGIISTVAGCEVDPCVVGDGGPAATTSIGLPLDLAFDGIGNLYFAESNPGPNVIRRIDTSGVITTVAGGGGELLDPQGVAIDATGNIFIAGADGHRIWRVDAATSVIETFAGTGARGFSGDGGAATGARVSFPDDVTLDSSGNVYIADAANHRVRRVENTSNTISTVAGTGTAGASGGGAATSAQLEQPGSVAIDSIGNLYISDASAHRIYRVSSNGVITTIAGTGDVGTEGDDGPATSAQLGAPEGVLVDGVGNVYFADSFASYHRIRRIDTAGKLTTIAGIRCPFPPCPLGDGGPATDALLSSPQGIALDSTGRLYIADKNHHRIRRIDLNGTITTIAGTGVAGNLGDDGPAINAQLSSPRGIAIDSFGTLYIVDTGNNRIRRVNTGGTMSAVASGALDFPWGIAVDASDRLYIADTLNYRVRRNVSGVVTTIAGTTINGIAAQGNSGDGLSATAATLNFPTGVAVDAMGNVYIADLLNASVRRVDASGILTTVAGPVGPDGMGPVTQARLADPQALVVTPSFTLVAGGRTGTVQASRAATASVDAVIGRYLSRPPTPMLARFGGFQFGTVMGVAYDASAGLIYLTESSQNRVRVVTIVDPADENTWTIATLAGSAGASGFLDGPAQAAQFRAPTGLYLDAAARQLYVADTGNHVVRAIDLSSGVAGATVRTIAGRPATRGFYGDGLMASDALLHAPRAITRCANGDVFIADTGNHRVRRIAAGNLMSTVLGVGVAASSGEGVPASTFPVKAPLGLACDASGNLYVTSTTTVRLVPANATGVVDGSGAATTIYGAPPRDVFPTSVTNCLSGLAVVDATTVQVVDSCTGLLVQLRRAPK